MFEDYTLENGVRVILVPKKDVASATAMVMYPMGSRYEPEKLSGVAHYIEHLMFKGTEKRPDTLTLTKEIDRLGAEYNAFTSKEYTGYYVKADGKYLETSIDILADMLFNSKFDPEEMEREKGPIIEELKMYKDNPLMNIGNIFEDLMYAGCPLGRDIGGTEAHVKSYQRDEVLEFKKKFYDPSNAIVIVAGAIDENTKQWLEQYFGAEPSIGEPSKDYIASCYGSGKKEDRIMVEHKDTDQLQLMIGFPGYDHQDENNATLSALLSILGGSMSSRLFIQVRERHGLAYMVKAGKDHFRDAGYAYVRAGLDPKNLNKALELIYAEIEKMKTELVSEEELADAKTHIQGGRTLSMEDTSTVAHWFADEALFHGTMETPEEFQRKIDAVTREDIMRVASELFDFEKIRVAMIGNVKREEVVW